MKRLQTVAAGLLAVAASLSSATGAQAATQYLFGGSGGNDYPYLETDNGIRLKYQSGWFTDQGRHVAENGNYLVGQVGATSYRNFLRFDITGLGIDNVTEFANLRLSLLENGLDLGGAPSVTWTLYDVSSVFESWLDYDGRTDIYDDLGSGVAFGSITLTANTVDLVVNFNEAGVAAVNAAFAGTGVFTVGGALTAGSDAVPEPAMLSLFGLGALLIVRSRRRITT